MSHLKQFSFEIAPGTFRNGPHASLIQIEANPFQHPKELLGFVNQHGTLKVHGIIDQNQPKVVHEFLMVGTGATIPSDLIDRLFRVDSVLLGDAGQYGYHLYMILDPRGIPEEGSDASLVAKLKIEIAIAANADDVAEQHLFDMLTSFCAQHRGVLRLHEEKRPFGEVEIHIYNESFSHDQVFLNFMGELYKAVAVDNVSLSKNV